MVGFCQDTLALSYPSYLILNRLACSEGRKGTLCDRERRREERRGKEGERKRKRENGISRPKLELSQCHVWIMLAKASHGSARFKE